MHICIYAHKPHTVCAFLMWFHLDMHCQCAKTETQMHLWKKIAWPILLLTHYAQLRQSPYWMIIFWTLEASVGRTSSKRFPPTSASAAPSTSTQRWRRRCMQGEGFRRRQYLAFKGWSRSWSRRRARRRGWRCWRWRRARLALTWDSRSFCSFIFFHSIKNVQFLYEWKIICWESGHSSELLVYWSHSRQKIGYLRCQVLCWGNHTKHIREILLRFPPSVA